MTVFEMEGFLRGKCVPGDLKVNESNAEYLVRKLSRVNQQLESLDKLAGLFLQLSTERGGRVAIELSAWCKRLDKAAIRKRIPSIIANNNHRLAVHCGQQCISHSMSNVVLSVCGNHFVKLISGYG